MRRRWTFAAGASAIISWKLREHALWVEGPENAAQDGTCSGIEAAISNLLCLLFAVATLISTWRVACHAARPYETSVSAS